jgi:regulation of enolase protein 1 (concanavalin A-like superfamily)
MDTTRANIIHQSFAALLAMLLVAVGTTGAGTEDVPEPVEEARAYDPAAPTARFVDVADGSVHAVAIQALAAAGVTQGCTPDRFCPAHPLTRAQLASLLVRLLELPSASSGYQPFVDVDRGASHAGSINALAEAGLVQGCEPGRYCPTRTLTRGQAATVLAAAWGLEPTGERSFSDLGNSVHARSILALADAGLTAGCSADRFCAGEPLTRAQFASFLYRAASRGGVDSPDPGRQPSPDDSTGGLVRTSIGAPTPTGDLMATSNGYILTGAGADIWGSSDSFEFAHRTLTGDGSVTVRVTNQSDTHGWAKAGIMVRSEDRPGATHVSLFQTPANGVALQYRAATSGPSYHIQGPTTSTPTWLRIERLGDSFSAYTSDDGMRWTLVGAVTVTVAAAALVGLAVTSHSDGTPSKAEFRDLEVSSLEDGVDSTGGTGNQPPPPDEGTAEDPPASPQTGRRGLLHTPEEVSVWRDRARSGPYRVAGDVSPNSPGDWTRIRKNASDFVSNPTAGRWNGPTQGSLSTCVQRYNDPPPTSGPSRLLDAAFVALVEGSPTEAELVKRELLWQASAAGTDFSNRSRWCHGVLVDINPSFDIAHWLTKLLLAYDYLGPDYFTPAERARLDAWFLEAARFLQFDLDRSLESRFVSRGSSDELSQAALQYPLCDKTHFLDGPPSCAIHRYYNNRRATIARFVGLAGLKVNDDASQRSARLFTQEYVKYGVFPQGFVSDFERWERHLPDLGWGYGAQTVGPVLVIADAFARAGDRSLYDFTTSVGAFGSEGGSKSLRFAARSIAGHVDGTYRRYGTDDPSLRGNNAYLIDGRHDASNWYGLHDVSFAIANVYYRESYLRGAYTRSGPGMGGYPSRPASIGPHPAWTGEGGIFPGVLFMYGQMEGEVWPY